MAQRKSPGPVEILVAGKSLNRTKSPGSEGTVPEAGAWAGFGANIHMTNHMVPEYPIWNAPKKLPNPNKVTPLKRSAV